MNREVYIVDTTLRDGEQAPGKAFTVNQKVEIARYLDLNGIYQIEAGTPAMGSVEKDCIIQIVDAMENSFVSTWNRINKNDIKHSIECNPDIIHLSVPSSEIQIYSNLRKDKTWVENNLKDCVYFAKEQAYEVTIGFEDASRADIKYLIHLCDILEKLDVHRVRYADTVGILSPSTTKKAITTLVENTSMEIEIHAHNDFGMATAISIEGAKCGAKYVNCTLDGIGERAGNCNMQEFIKSTKGFFPNMHELDKD
ncbi:homocitrate synthase [Clostridium sp. SHJSY1]|uniref:homocitrate synthase n=1 Tax=Clostridium sp. SHJSY1 TaxID=2942483 RepID=UPI002874D01D|nr:homocitrate synthase [Clostridium sp. SHJSY1]MDS0526891.1 homocitrate synthase [Clostridium sp. SHJSY1]